jgi:hypothetical protein
MNSVNTRRSEIQWNVFDSCRPFALGDRCRRELHLPAIKDTEQPWRPYFTRPIYELFDQSSGEIERLNKMARSQKEPDPVLLEKLFRSVLNSWQIISDEVGIPKSILPFNGPRIKPLTAKCISDIERKTGLKSHLISNAVVGTLLIRDSMIGPFRELLTPDEWSALRVRNITESDWSEVEVKEGGEGFLDGMPFCIERDSWLVPSWTGKFINSVREWSGCRIIRIHGHSAILVESSLLTQLVEIQLVDQDMFRAVQARNDGS